MQTVHPVAVDDIEPWLATLATAMLGTPWDDVFALRVDRWKRDWSDVHTWGVRDQGRYIATLATESSRLTVPAAAGATTTVAANAVTAVSVAATHRRRGLLRSMITAAERAAKDRGELVSILLAAEWPIYGRFGFAPATWCADFTYHVRQAGARMEPAPTGSVRQVEPDELVKYAPGIYDRERAQLAGGIDRAGTWWSRQLGTNGFEPMPFNRATLILHESPDGPDGFLSWKPGREVDFGARLGSVKVLELVAATPTAYRNLFAYLCGLDLVEEVELRDRPVDEPARWLIPDGRALSQTRLVDDLWLRILDAPGALEARGYAASGQLVIEIVDADGDGFAAGRYLLDAGTDGARCLATTRSADLTVPQRALARAYLGDRTLRALAVAGGVDEHTVGALARLDAMLATPRPPYNGTGF